MHTVAVLAMDDVVAFDLSTAIEVFGRARLPDGRKAYRVRVCAAKAEVRCAAFTLDAPWGLEDLAEADTIIVPGCDEQAGPVDPRVTKALRAASERGTRIASICAGAFVLAAAGLLDGLAATTHWVAADTARMSVMPLEREGGQAQFIVHDLPPVPKGSSLEPVLAWIEDHLAQQVTLRAMAARCGMSERTFSRRFREQTGTTPLQ